MDRMMSRMLSRPLFFVVLIFGALAAGHVAAADLARQAKDTGFVGERLDGYLGYVEGEVPARVVSMVEEVNAKRRLAYEKVAEETGQDLGKVEAVAGSKLIQKAQRGDWVMNAAGEWIQR